MGASRPSNNDPRGSAAQRRARKIWMLQQFGDGYTAPCAFCEIELDYHTLTADRWPVLGCDGGRYVRGNIRPACLHCNSSEGAKERARRHQERKARNEARNSRRRAVVRPG
jgi:hypothetical protein